ncbi:MAG TPA: thioredoxin domain-containing protein, partial [Polyangia bacterium]|nr:thioredoxin domain-containing protein [Polyangia bacterium]
AIAPVLTSRPMAMTEALLALDWVTSRPREVAIILPRGAGPESAAPLLDVLRARFLPHVVRAVVGEDEVAALGTVAPFVEGKVAQGGRATAYVCERGACQLPTQDPAVFAAQLTGPKHP